MKVDVECLCKDCHYSSDYTPYIEDDGTKMYTCSLIEGIICPVKENDFCSYAKSKED